MQQRIFTHTHTHTHIACLGEMCVCVFACVKKTSVRARQRVVMCDAVCGAVCLVKRKKIAGQAVLRIHAYKRHCNALQHAAAHYNTLQRNATHCNRSCKRSNRSPLFALYNTLQHTATHCNRTYNNTHDNTHCNTHCCCKSSSRSPLLPLYKAALWVRAAHAHTRRADMQGKPHTATHIATHCNASQHTASHEED